MFTCLDVKVQGLIQGVERIATHSPFPTKILCVYVVQYASFHCFIVCTIYIYKIHIVNAFHSNNAAELAALVPHCTIFLDQPLTLIISQ